MKEVYIVSAARTAVGSFCGTLKDFSARDLGSITIKEVIKRAGVEPSLVDEVFMGNVLSAGKGQNIARQCLIDSGIPDTVPALTVSKVCGSGLRSISLGYQTIVAGDNDVVVAGGTESMSTANYVLENHRLGVKMGDVKLVDTMLTDGLVDAFSGVHMGITAENLAAKNNLTREEQDEFAYKSQQKAKKAQEEGKFVDEIVPITITPKRKPSFVFENDEYIKGDTSLEVLAKLRPAFKKDGTVTAGNASGLNDGAAAVLLMSDEKVKETGVKPMAKILGHATVGCDPQTMGIGPVETVRKALKRANLTLDDIGLIESNEAFAAQALSVAKELNFNMDIVNVNGGAIAIGHAIGSSGARILNTLLFEMKKRNVRYGLATLCIGGGMGTAIVVENVM